MNKTLQSAEITAYTDGSCLKNPGPGGWGVVIVRSDGSAQRTLRKLSGGTADTTKSDVMELTAAIEAIKALSPIDAPITISSESEYVINGATIWMSGWKAIDWVRPKKGPVKNRILWQELDALNSPLISWKRSTSQAANNWKAVATNLAYAAAVQHSAQQRAT